MTQADAAQPKVKMQGQSNTKSKVVLAKHIENTSKIQGAISHQTPKFNSLLQTRVEITQPQFNVQGHM